MAEKGIHKSQEADSGSESRSSSDDAEEATFNFLSGDRVVNVAVAGDEAVWVGVDTERRSDKGGQEFNFELPLGYGGFGVKRSEKENILIQRIAWRKLNCHE